MLRLAARAAQTGLNTTAHAANSVFDVQWQKLEPQFKPTSVPNRNWPGSTIHTTGSDGFVEEQLADAQTVFSKLTEENGRHQSNQRVFPIGIDQDRRSTPLAATDLSKNKSPQRKRCFRQSLKKMDATSQTNKCSQ
jgi:hypothetical protein